MSDRKRERFRIVVYPESGSLSLLLTDIGMICFFFWMLTRVIGLTEISMKPLTGMILNA